MTSTTEHTSITQQAQAVALVLADAHQARLPQPHRVECDDLSGVVMRFLDLDALRAWAGRAEAPVERALPIEYLPGRWSVRHEARGSIYELPVTLAACEVGVMVAADRYQCKACHAVFGTSGGFVADGTYNDWFETELTRHMDGACVGSVVAL